MQFDEIKDQLAQHFDDAHIEVSGDGSHFDVLIVSDAFTGLRPVKKQQMVYAAINDRIANGSMHAVNMQLFTKDEWAARNA